MQIQKASIETLQVLPKRTKGSYTDSFRTMDVVSNHFEVKITENFEKLFIFSIKFDPMIPRDNRQKRKDLLQAAWQDICAMINNPAVCGMNLISTREPTEEIKEFDLGEHKLTVKKVKVIDVQNDPKTLLFFLNNRFRNTMSEAGYSEIGRTGKYFNIRSKKKIDNLNMYSGFKANFCSLEKGIFLRVDSARKIVRDQTVLDFIDELYKKNEGKDREDKRNIVRNALKDLIIQVNYGNGRYYKIEDIVYKDLTEEFTCGEKINMLDYYRTKYNINIKKPKQPLLKVENKKQGGIEILLVPELCLMTGIPDDFDEFKRKKISEQTILDARTKKNQILSIMNEIEKTDDFAKLEQVGLKLNKRLYNFKGKTIPVPRITLGDEQRVQDGKQAFFNLFSQPIFASKHKIKLAILYFRADLRDLIRTFESTSKNLQVQFEYDKYELRDERNGVDDIKKTLKKAIERGSNICLVVIPPNMKSQYKRIKEACLIDNKIVCQVAVEATLRKKNAQSIATKILLQIIAKRGNTLWVPKTKSKVEETMLVGIDNCTLQGGKNLLAACGTVNSTFTSIYTKTVEYNGVEGKFAAINTALLDIVNYYVDRNKVPPKDIILFTNAVSFDQVRILKENFIDEFMKKAEEIYHQKCPALQVVMVNTKTSERFFTDNGENVRAGTFINSDIVSKDYDFYLVSQNSNRGCIVPNHYKIIYTNSKMEEGVLSELIFGQCFNYVNWSGSIKVPGILQYAKKCAKFHSEVMDEKKLSESLERCLYFV